MLGILELLAGKKTYLVAILTAVLGVLQAFGIVLPEFVWTLLGAVGLGTVRAAISKL